ncbi:hypothetical protein [Lujinxingia litoralis]|uniref:hypothetical protein n=1 Tax=Lujinxingia litoralis TaxID=2211119 RepID=UPI0011B934ED|nr:hypothetical protein [Lujinxingia litoralis]
MAGLLLFWVMGACASPATPTREQPEHASARTYATPTDPLYVAEQWLARGQESGEYVGMEVVRAFTLDDGRLELILSPPDEPPATPALRVLLARDQEGWEVVETATIRSRQDWPRY